MEKLDLKEIWAESVEDEDGYMERSGAHESLQKVAEKVNEIVDWISSYSTITK